MALIGSSSRDFTMAPGGVGLPTHKRIPLFTLESPVPFLFIMLKLLPFSFSSICRPQACTLWWLLLLVGHWVTSSSKLVSMACLCHALEGGQVCG